MLTPSGQRKEGKAKKLGWGDLFPLMARSSLIDNPRQAQWIGFFVASHSQSQPVTASIGGLPSIGYNYIQQEHPCAHF